MRVRTLLPALALSALLSASALAEASRPIGAPQYLIGGTQVDHEDFRFVAQVSAVDGRTCTGVIIDPSWVLTTATCVIRSNGAVVHPRSIDIRRGSPRGGSEVRVGPDDGAKRVIVHPEYQRRTERGIRFPAGAACPGWATRPLPAAVIPRGSLSDRRDSP